MVKEETHHEKQQAQKKLIPSLIVQFFNPVKFAFGQVDKVAILAGYSLYGPANYFKTKLPLLVLCLARFLLFRINDG